MKVKYLCGHEADVNPGYAPYVKRSLCPECKKRRDKLMEEQRQKFNITA